MRRFIYYLNGIIIISVIIVNTCFAGGYQLNEQGARATGMGGAFVAQASDPSAVYFNPAGLAFQKGLNVLGGVTCIYPSTTYIPPRTPSLKIDQLSQKFYPINFYGSYSIDDQWVIGLGLFSPFGLGTEWASGWLGNESAVKTSLQTFYVNPSISYKINNDLSVGLGVSYVYANVFMSTNPYAGWSNSRIELEGSGKGFNINAGILYKPYEDLSIGLSYRMKTNIRFKGNARTYGMKSTTNTWLSVGGTSTNLPLPANLMVGVAYEAAQKLTLEYDFQFVQWSAYERLTVGIPRVLLGQEEISLKKQWHDGYISRFGIAYKYNKELTLRFGETMDMTPQPVEKMEPMLPDADRLSLSLGFSYKFDEQLSADFAYMLVLFSERMSSYQAPVSRRPDMSGEYRSNAHIVGVNIAYAFGE